MEVFLGIMLVLCFIAVATTFICGLVFLAHIWWGLAVIAAVAACFTGFAVATYN